MAVAFPLYDQLRQLVIDSPSKAVPDWPRLNAVCAQLPDTNRETIYALILHHHQLHGQEGRQRRVQKATLIPYGGKTFENGKGALFDIDASQSLPSELQSIIAAYISAITE